MSARIGFARLGQVMIIGYWILALSVVALTAASTYRAAQPNVFDEFPRTPDAGKPWEAYWHPYTVDIGGHRVGFLEPDQKSLDADIKAWANAHPPSKPLTDAVGSLMVGILVAAAVFAALWALVRAIWWVALGFIEKPSS